MQVGHYIKDNEVYSDEIKAKGVNTMEIYTLQVVANREDLKSHPKDFPQSPKLMSAIAYQPSFFLPAVRLLAGIRESVAEEKAPSNIYYSHERKVK